MWNNPILFCRFVFLLAASGRGGAGKATRIRVPVLSVAPRAEGRGLDFKL